MDTRTDSFLSSFRRTSTVMAAASLAVALARGQQDPAAAPATAPAVVDEAAAQEAPEFDWVDGWGQLPDGKELGNTHGCMCVDKQGRILANTDTAAAVVIFSPDGELLDSWGEEFRGGLHGMCLREEDGEEFLYLAHTMRSEVIKTDLHGKVQWVIGWPEAAGIYAEEGQYRPTSVVTASDGRLYVADGYGKSWVHVYDRDRSYVKSFGGPGTEPGKMRTPHGLWIDRRGDRELLLVCDRENHRLQWFTLDGEFVRQSTAGMLRPCNVWPLEDGMLAVADLVGRVTVLDRDDRPLCHLGEGAPPELRAKNGVGREHWKNGVFFSPHSVCADRSGDLYVMDWNSLGRISKLRRRR